VALRSLRSWAGVPALIAGIAASAGGLLLLVAGAGPVQGQSPLPWWALIPLFALAEIFVIHLPTARNAHTHSLREVPTVLALAFLGPLGYLAAHLLGAGSAVAIHARQRGTKLGFNICWFALEAALGVVVYRAVLGGASAASPRGWLAALIATVVTDLVGAALVTLVIRLVEGESDRSIVRAAATRGVIAAAANTCLASLVVVLTVREPEALPLLVTVLLTVFAAYRSAVALHRRSAQAELLYRFVKDAGRSVDLDAAVHSILVGARELLGASSAELVLSQPEGRRGVRLRLESGSDEVVRDSLAEPHGPWWSDASNGRSVLRSAGEEPAEDGEPRDGMAVPMLLEGAIQGVLVVTDRSFELDTFGERDLRLFEALTAHAAVALSNARLVDRLQRLLEQREYEAGHDLLTTLPNHRELLRRTEAALKEGRGAAIVLQVGDVQDVSEVLGRTAGDGLLKALAQRLQALAGDAVGALDRGSFALVLPGVDASSAIGRAHDLVDALQRPVPVDGVPLYVSVHAGVASAPEHTDAPEPLLHAAAAAAHAAASSGVPVDVHSPAVTEAVSRRLLLAADLAEAVENGGLEVWFQPQADAATGAVTGAEALLRWTHPRFGAVPPPEIVALAERTALMRRISTQVLARALERRAAWAHHGHLIDVSVNLTVDDVTDVALPTRVAELLGRFDVPAHALTLEITEGGIMSDPERTIGVLEALHQIGVRLSVDDFGTGHSSLAYLDRLPVDEVKVDQSFVRRLADESSAPTVVRASVSLAHELGLRVVAEGVENEALWRRVAELGCNVVQGYHLGRPMTSDALLSWMLARSALDAEGAAVGSRARV